MTTEVPDTSAARTAGRRARRIAFGVMFWLLLVRVLLPTGVFLGLWCGAGVIWVVWRRHTLGRRRWFMRYAPLWLLLFGLLGLIVATPYSG
jgi:hypothetical protein